MSLLYAFLSSPVLGLEDVRATIHDMRLPDGRTIWVDEIDRPRSRTEPSLVTIDDLFRLIREASVLLILLGSERHGSGLRIDDQTAHVSYWEAELFYAVLLGKTVQVFEVDGFQPDAKLAALLEMFRHALPPDRMVGATPKIAHRGRSSRLPAASTVTSSSEAECREALAQDAC